MRHLKLIKELLIFSLPISFSNLLFILIGFFTNYYLAKLGNTAIIASYALANTILITVNAFSGSILYSVSIFISHANGNLTRIKAIICNGLVLSLVLGISAIFIVKSGTWVLLALGEDSTLVKLSAVFLDYIALTMPVSLALGLFSQVFIGLNKPIIATVINGVRLPLSIVLNYYFIVYQKLGLTGAGMAWFHFSWISPLIVIVYICCSKYLTYFKLKLSDVKLKTLMQLFNLGANIGLQYLAELGAISLATIFMGYMGTEALASAQVASQYSILLIMLNLGIAQALASKTSHAYANSNFNLAKAYLKASWVLTLGIFIFASTIYIINYNGLISLFIKYHQSKQEFNWCVWFLGLSLVSVFLDSIKNLYTSALRGFHNSFMPMIIGSLSLWLISVPLSYLLGRVYGPIALRLGFLFGFLIAAFILYYYHQYYVKIKELEVRYIYE